MIMSTVVYFDGSYIPKTKIIGTGVRLFSDGWEIERTCHYTVSDMQNFKNPAGSHELYAFLDACKAIMELHIAPSVNVGLYTDYDVLHRFNANVESSRIQMQTLLQQTPHSRLVVEYSQKLLNTARVIPVKSHVGYVDNERVDYLARCAARAVTPRSYDDWLRAGRKRWLDNDTCVVQPYPFMGADA
jgi:ribonuclease HI